VDEVTGTDSLDVDPTNTDQARAWDGDEGSYWAAHADHFDRAVAPHHRRLLAAAAIGAGEQVLDVGCGTGQTTRDAARAASSGHALGVDLSTAMLEVARERARAEGLSNAQFERADAQVHPFAGGTFDVVVSRTGAMFFGDLVAAFTNIDRAVRPDGRLVLLTWQELARNEWIRAFSGSMAAGRDLPPPPPDAPGPFALAQPDRVRAVLSAAGFVDIDLEPVDEPMWFGDDADDAHRLVSGLLGWMLEGLDDERRRHALDALHGAMTAHETPDGVLFQSAAWLIGARRP
jgi:SAM-dependent methyltransferase